MKILIWDIETYPLVVTSWTLFPKEPLSHENIVSESGLICAAWKWLDERKVHVATIDPRNPREDREVIEALHAAISEADVLVAHYGDKFDLPKFKARAIFHGLPPVPPVLTIDTKKVASRIFGFNSNRLDYLGKFLGLGQKHPTSYGMWTAIMKGDDKALRKMVRYNKQDVVLLEAVYKTLRPYMANHPNEALFKPVEACPVCGSEKFKKEGFKYARTTKRQQYQCSNEECRAWFSGEIVKTVGVK